MTPPSKDQRDWDKELAKVDQAMARDASRPNPPAAPRTGVTPAVGAAPAARTVTRKDSVFTWVRLVLALVLGIGMTQWPYLHGCGLSLFAYLGGAVTVMVASIWTMLSSWRSRSTAAHFLSIALLFWGSVLAAREVLPRVGYAKTQANWTCAQPGQPNPAITGPTP